MAIDVSRGSIRRQEGVKRTKMFGERLTIVAFNLVLRCKVNVDGAANLVDERLAQNITFRIGTTLNLLSCRVSSRKYRNYLMQYTLPNIIIQALSKNINCSDLTSLMSIITSRLF